MKKTIYFFILLVSFSKTIAQEITHAKAPKQYSFEFGYRNLFGQSHFNNNSTHGYGMLFDYAWQLSGFDGKKNKSYISVPMGYTLLMANTTSDKNIHMLNYGWTVRHELGRNKPIVPFIGYGLLLNNMRKTDTEGSVFGHQTQFDVGLNLSTSSRLTYFVKIEYSYTSYPKFDDPQRIRLHYADIRIGTRF